MENTSQLTKHMFHTHLTADDKLTDLFSKSWTTWPAIGRLLWSLQAFVYWHCLMKTIYRCNHCTEKSYILEIEVIAGSTMCLFTPPMRCVKYYDTRWWEAIAATYTDCFTHWLLNRYCDMPGTCYWCRKKVQLVCLCRDGYLHFATLILHKSHNIHLRKHAQNVCYDTHAPPTNANF